MVITRNNARYELNANEMFEVFCIYELKCDMAYAEENCRDDEFFANNSDVINKLIFREIALDMRDLTEQGNSSKPVALRVAKDVYQERVLVSELSIIDFLKEELCREVGRRVGAYKRIKNEYVLIDGQTKVTFANPAALLDCYLPFLYTADPNNVLWGWAMQFMDENR